MPGWYSPSSLYTKIFHNHYVKWLLGDVNNMDSVVMPIVVCLVQLLCDLY